MLRLFLGFLWGLLAVPVFAAGLPPVVSPIPNQSIFPKINDAEPKNLASVLTFQIMASDPELDPLFYSVKSFKKAGSDIPTPEKFDVDDANGVVAWKVRPHEVGSYQITFSIKDCRPQEGQRNCSGGETLVTANVEIQLPEICSGSSAICTFLKANSPNTTSGTAGNTGDFYMCGDYDAPTSYHSSIGVAALPQLDFMDKISVSEFTENPFGNSRGYESRIWPGRVVIGNSSTAYTSGANWGGHNKVNCLGNSSGAQRTYEQYTSNHHFFYPEHRDHDEKDHYHAKTLYCTSSQGSSGSERDELSKFVRTLAAFKTSVKDRLREEGLLIPMLQLISRRTRVANDAEYLTGKAHPNAFDNFGNDLAMVEMAHGIDIDNIPPIAVLDLEDHSYDSEPGVGHFDTRPELFFETPQSIAFIFRGKAFTKKVTLSARNSYDLNNRPLTYHWSVLRGSGVRITPLEADSSRVEVEIDYHPETTIEGGTRLTNLVEVGLFVHNGAYYSPPAFVSSFSLNNEERDYLNGRIQEIRYVDKYVYPPISQKRSWNKDVFHYDSNQQLTGWTRHLADSSTESYNALGHCLSCQKRRVTGNVSISGRGLGRVTLVAKTSNGTQGPYRVRTETNGSFELPAIAENSYRLEAEGLPPGYRSSSIFVTVSGADLSGRTVNVSCAPGFSETPERTCVSDDPQVPKAPTGLRVR